MTWAAQRRKVYFSSWFQRTQFKVAWLCVLSHNMMAVGVCGDLMGPWKQRNRKTGSIQEKIQPLTTQLHKPAPLLSPPSNTEHCESIKIWHHQIGQISQEPLTSPRTFSIPHPVQCLRVSLIFSFIIWPEYKEDSTDFSPRWIFCSDR